MKKLNKESLALRITVFGFLSHYVYSILLFLSSQLMEKMSLPLSIFYFVITGLPIIILCLLTIIKDRGGLHRSTFENRQKKMVGDEFTRSHEP